MNKNPMAIVTTTALGDRGEGNYSLRLADKSKAELDALFNATPENERSAFVSQLTSCLNSTNYRVRANAIYLLGLLGEAAQSAVPSIILSMNCWNCRVGMETADALKKIGASHAIPELLATLHPAPEPDATDITWTTQDENLLHCFAILGPSAAAQAPKLAAYIHFMYGVNPALINIGPAAIPAVLKEIQRAQQKNRTRVCTHAAYVLSSIGSDPSQFVIEMLESGTTRPDGRLAISVVLSQLRPPALNNNLLPALQQLLTDSDPAVQSHARKALDNLESAARPKTSRNELVDIVLNTVRTGTYLSDSSKARLQELLSAAPDSEKESLVVPLSLCLKSDQYIERTNAVFVLGALGACAAAQVPDLIESVKNSNCKYVTEVADALPKIGTEPVVPELLKALPLAPSPSISSYGFSRHGDCILECLERFGPALAGFAPTLAAYLRSGKVNQVLKNIGTQAIPSILIEVVKSEGLHGMPWVCEHAADVLSTFGSACALPLIDTLTSAPGAREGITTVISKLRSQSLGLDAAPALSKLLLDASPKVQHNVKSSLLALGGSAAPDVCKYLAPLAFDESREYHDPQRRSARYRLDEMLKQFGTSAVPALKSRLAHEELKDPKSRAHLAVAILKISPDEEFAAETLISLLRDESTEIKLMALSAVAECKCEAPNLVPALMKLWAGPHPAVRQKAAGVLTALGLVNYNYFTKFVTAVTCKPASKRLVTDESSPST